MGRTSTLLLRGGFGFFAFYLTVMTAAILSPAVFDLVIGGVVGLKWPAARPREMDLLANMTLCGLVPTAYMAARTAFLGEWTRVSRGFFLCMLGANVLANVWSIAHDRAFAGILAGDFVLVVALLAIAIAVRPAGEAV